MVSGSATNIEELQAITPRRQIPLKELLETAAAVCKACAECILLELLVGLGELACLE
jgi:hypothetical protein